MNTRQFYTAVYSDILKYMPWKWGTKVEEWEVFKMLPHFPPLYAFTKILKKVLYICFFKESFTCVNKARYEWLLIHQPDGCSGGSWWDIINHFSTWCQRTTYALCQGSLTFDRIDSLLGELRKRNRKHGLQDWKFLGFHIFCLFLFFL